MAPFSSELWSVPRVAEHLDISTKRVYHLIRDGEIESMRLSQRGIRVLRTSVEAFVQRQVKLQHRRLN